MSKSEQITVIEIEYSPASDRVANTIQEVLAYSEGGAMQPYIEGFASVRTTDPAKTRALLRKIDGVEILILSESVDEDDDSTDLTEDNDPGFFGFREDAPFYGSNDWDADGVCFTNGSPW